MFAWMVPALGLFLAAAHLAFFTKDRSPGNVARICLLYWLPLVVGLGGLIAFTGHTMRADDIARSIGWPAGNPFQFEVAVANLAFGILGFLCLKFRDGFWTATILGYGVFLEGAACIHIREIVTAGNWSTNNAGPILLIDVLIPILLLALLLVAKAGQGRAQG
jgi:hypothetical protein